MGLMRASSHQLYLNFLVHATYNQHFWLPFFFIWASMNLLDKSVNAKNYENDPRNAVRMRPKMRIQSRVGATRSVKLLLIRLAAPFATLQHHLHPAFLVQISSCTFIVNFRTYSILLIEWLDYRK